MQFSNIIQGASQAIFSQDSTLIAISNGSKVLVKETKELTNKHVFSFPDIITHMELSPDNYYLLVVQSNSGTVEVKSFLDEHWVCKITDSACGLLHAIWSPDSRSIITFSDFQMKATVYNLTDKNQFLIKNPKYAERGVSFSSDGKFMALAERRDIKDYIGIYYTRDWKLVNVTSNIIQNVQIKHFQVDTMDLVDIKWSKDDGSILVWDSSINYKFLVYHPSSGLIQRIQPYEYALGIKCVELSNTPHYVAIGSFDDKVRLINTLTWKVITELEHKANLKEYNNPIVYREQNSSLLNAQHLVDRTTTSCKNYFYFQNVIKNSFNKTVVIDDSIGKLPSAKQATDKSQSGIQDISFSFNANYIASKSGIIYKINTKNLKIPKVLFIQINPFKIIKASFPNAVFIWDVQLLELRYLILLQNPVKGFIWSNNSNNLIIYASSNKIYFWSLDGASVCELPQYGKTFSVNKVLWNRSSKCLILIDRKDAIIGYPPIDLDHHHEVEEQDDHDYHEN